MSDHLKGPKGAPDILPPRSASYEHVIDVATRQFARYGYSRIDTPVFEHTEVFLRGLAEGSDIVSKEMYTFEDKGGRSLTLRPDMTAPVVRAIIEHGLDKQGTAVKLYYAAPVFRHERPQAGRTRQFTQVGVECVGTTSPESDAEVIELAASVYAALGIEARLLLNSIGHPGCRSEYMPSLVAFLRSHSDQLCEDCKRKIDRNPLRTFDCKVERDRAIMENAPMITDHLCEPCSEHHMAVMSLLSDVSVEFTKEPKLVRGLDYYTKTTFEFVSEGLGSQDAVGAGGRYDGLAEQLGGDPSPGIGFGLGVDRMVLVLESLRDGSILGPPAGVFVAPARPDLGRDAFRLATQLRHSGSRVVMDQSARNLKGQLRSANRAGAAFAVILGPREIEASTATVRDMSSGQESDVPFGSLHDWLKERL